MKSSRHAWVVWLVVGLVIAVPVAEVAVLIATGRLIGALPTVLLMIATSLLGAWLAQREGRKTWAALRTAFESGRFPTGEVADAVLVMVGGLFLMLPGFISDVIGLVCLLPITRPLGRRLLTWLVNRAAGRRGVTVDSLLTRATVISDPSSVIRGETVPDPGTPQAPDDGRVVRGEIL